MNFKTIFRQPTFLVGCFALLNVAMYLSIKKFWIGGSSFLPMIGITGTENKFLFAFIVNLGVIAGAMIGAISSREFRLRIPRPVDLPRTILGGILIGIGVTLAPGTCTTSFVSGMEMLSVSSYLSAAGIFIGAYIMFKIIWGGK
ncbi:MAG: YeeE/YedE family protein [Deltaproteobacteria bacterium]|nr:YeeE/YedE family protein [Deltaproteobacteria bacterium]